MEMDNLLLYGYLVCIFCVCSEACMLGYEWNIYLLFES